MAANTPPARTSPCCPEGALPELLLQVETMRKSAVDNGLINRTSALNLIEIEVGLSVVDREKLDQMQRAGDCGPDLFFLLRKAAIVLRPEMLNYLQDAEIASALESRLLNPAYPPWHAAISLLH